MTRTFDQDKKHHKERELLQQMQFRRSHGHYQYSTRRYPPLSLVVLADDTVFRVLHNDIEISTHVGKSDNRITYLRATRRSQGSDASNPST